MKPQILFSNPSQHYTLLLPPEDRLIFYGWGRNICNAHSQLNILAHIPPSSNKISIRITIESNNIIEALNCSIQLEQI